MTTWREGPLAEDGSAQSSTPFTSSRSFAMTPLRQRMMDDKSSARTLAPNTQSSYLLQVSSFATHFRRSPEALRPEEIRAWLVYLREEPKRAPATLHPAVGAVLFLYVVTQTRPCT